MLFFTHKNFLLRRIAARRLLFLFRIRSGKNKYLLRRCLFSFLANKNAVAEMPRHIISIYLHSYSMFSEVIPVRYLFSINMSLKINICFTSLSFLFVDLHNKPSIWKMIYFVKPFSVSGTLLLPRLRLSPLIQDHISVFICNIFLFHG